MLESCYLPKTSGILPGFCSKGCAEDGVRYHSDERSDPRLQTDRDSDAE